MSEVKISFKNYKKVPDVEYDLSNGSIFFIQGPNDAGKTSFVHALQSIMEVKDDTKNPTRNGEKEGFYTGTIPGADGKQYQFRYDFNIDNKNKFIFIGPDGKPIKKIGEMREIFNYTHFTVEDFWNMSKTEKGRQQQREILMKLLSESERNEISNIDSLINTSTGTKYLQRQTINKEIDSLKTLIESRKLTALELETKNKKQQAENLITKLQNELDANNLIISNSSTFEVRLEAAEDKLKNFDDVVNPNIESLEKDIKELEKQLEEKRTLLQNNKDRISNERPDLVTAVENIRKEFDSEKLEAAKKLVNGLDEDEFSALESAPTEVQLGLKRRLERGKSFIKSIDAIITKEDLLKKDENTIKEKEKSVEVLNEEIETLRKRRKDIVRNSDSIPHDYEIGDDHISIEGIPFFDTDISKSKATKAIARLMMKVNQAPILLMGDAEALGYEVLDQLQEEAAALGKIMIFAEHNRDVEEVRLVCYDDIEHTKKPSKESGSLF